MEIRGHCVSKGAAASSTDSAPAPKVVDKGAARSRTGAKKEGIHATITPKPVRAATASAASKATTVVSSANLKVRRQSVVELSLVENLKKQIAFLEAQIVCLKRQQEMKRPPVPTVAPAHADPSIAPENPSAGGFAGVPEPYQTEMVSLQLNLERVLADYDAVHSQNRYIDEEKCTMATEIVDLRTELRVAQQGRATAEAEKQAAMEALAAEQAGRQLLEEQLPQAAGRSPSSQLKAPELMDVLHQKDYFKVQVDRLKVREGVLAAKAGALEAALNEERANSKSLEAELCAALDRVGELEARDERLRVFYAKLGGRYITTAATLRKVLDAAKQGNDEKGAALYAGVKDRCGGAMPVRNALAQAEAFAEEVKGELPDVAIRTPPNEEPLPGQIQQPNEEGEVAGDATCCEPAPCVLPPPPPAASVPSPPPPPAAAAATLPPPLPPATSIPVPEPAKVPDHGASTPPPAAADANVPQTPLQRELAQLEARIASEEASLAAFVASNGGESQ